MRLSKIEVINFRTIENLELDFHPTYTALCGPNDSGKTNVIRAIRKLIDDDDGPHSFLTDGPDFASKNDFPKWKKQDPAESRVELAISLTLSRVHDAGLFQSVTKQLSLDHKSDTLQIRVAVSYSPGGGSRTVTVRTDERESSDLDAQEVLRRLQSSHCILFHNSTQIVPWFVAARNGASFFRDLSQGDEATLSQLKKSVNGKLTKITKGKQRQLEQLLGKLETSYKVGLSLPTFDFTNVACNITLGDAKYKVRLDDWGSGTRNRTEI